MCCKRLGTILTFVSNVPWWPFRVTVNIGEAKSRVGNAALAAWDRTGCGAARCVSNAGDCWWPRSRRARAFWGVRVSLHFKHLAPSVEGAARRAREDGVPADLRLAGLHST
jgi:hypothetical protein